MRLKTVVLENFRLFHTRTRIEVDDLTALIGRNDFGKSTVLEALEIFFNNSVVKIDADDPCVRSDSKIVRIGCVFDDLPEDLVLDSTVETTLKDEYLLNSDGDLEIHKIFDCSKSKISVKIITIAEHPSAPNANDLLLLKQTDLRKRYRDLGLNEDDVDMRVNAAIRRAIWKKVAASPDGLSLKTQEISLDKEDAKKAWDQLSKYLPTFALFQADRPSTDADAEVQDPMKLAVREAIKSVEKELAEIRRVVEEKAVDVAKRTLEKLQEMDKKLAKELKPRFTSEPKWEGFKLSLVGDDGIPMNKRGSGTRRLILLNFFRAEAERKAEEEGHQSIIYAIEEPEVSQHPTNLKLLVDAFLALSEREGCQVLLTTHVPGIAGLLPVQSLRLIQSGEDRQPVISADSETVYQQIVDALGVLPDLVDVKKAQDRLKVIVCVEGKNDVAFLHHMSRLLRTKDNTLPDLENDPRITCIPLHGASLRDWVFNHYLKQAGIPEVHIYDRDEDRKYQSECDSVNARGDGSYATLTGKLMMESYLHPKAINEVFGINISFTDIDDAGGNVPFLVAKKLREDKTNLMRKQIRPKKNASDPGSWENEVKKLLNDDVAQKMTLEMLDVSDPDQEIESWLREINKLLH